jgi:hypothetical protein
MLKMDPDLFLCLKNSDCPELMKQNWKLCETSGLRRGAAKTLGYLRYYAALVGSWLKEQPRGPIFKGQSVNEARRNYSWTAVIVVDETDRPSRNVDNQTHTNAA